jgi:hypothetical protein
MELLAEGPSFSPAGPSLGDPLPTVPLEVLREALEVRAECGGVSYGNPP